MKRKLIMSKKKIRDITVDNKQYAWRVVCFDEESSGDSYLEIWRNKNDKMFTELVKYGTIVTPKDVEKKIREIEAHAKIVESV